MATFIINDIEVKPIVTHYLNNGNLAVCLEETDSGEQYAVLTVNIKPLPRNRAALDMNCPLGPDGLNAENFILAYGLGFFTGTYITSGFCTYPVYEFNPKFLEENYV